MTARRRKKLPLPTVIRFKAFSGFLLPIAALLLCFVQQGRTEQQRDVAPSPTGTPPAVESGTTTAVGGVHPSSPSSSSTTTTTAEPDGGGHRRLNQDGTAWVGSESAAAAATTTTSTCKAGWSTAAAGSSPVVDLASPPTTTPAGKNEEDGDCFAGGGSAPFRPDRMTTEKQQPPEEDAAAKDHGELDNSVMQEEPRRDGVSAHCTVVMAPSTLPHAGWGVFTLRPRQRGDPLLPGDVVIQLTDFPPDHFAAASGAILRKYLWSDASETGGMYESIGAVQSVAPGIGMLANGLPPPYHNVLPFVPRVDEGGLTRQQYPGAGAITHYHNYTYFAHKDLAAGSELFVNYGSDWFEEHRAMLVTDLRVVHSDGGTPTFRNTTRDVDWLRQHGMCLDHLRPGSRSRILPQAGRAVTAAHAIPAESLVAPVPVLPLRRETLRTRHHQNHHQLLLNYCFGHKDSSLLLYPYGPLVNLINHGATNDTRLEFRANVRLTWSDRQRGSDEASRRSAADPGPGPMLLELRALRDIASGEELLLDYGPVWSEAWAHHVAQWTPPPGADSYAPSYVHDDAIRALRLESELDRHPYPNNIFTSCFYRYSDHNQNGGSSGTGAAGASTTTTSTTITTTVPWKATRGIFELSNLRPCRILRREHRPKEGTVFTVQVKNRPHLHPKEIIPPGEYRVVERVPRHAIRFSDKPYTTDQHLDNAFRHEIGLGDDVFPLAWRDLARDPVAVPSANAADQDNVGLTAKPQVVATD